MGYKEYWTWEHFKPKKQLTLIELLEPLAQYEANGVGVDFNTKEVGSVRILLICSFNGSCFWSYNCNVGQFGIFRKQDNQAILDGDEYYDEYFK